jgi:hypothetical protein
MESKRGEIRALSLKRVGDILCRVSVFWYGVASQQTQ